MSGKLSKEEYQKRLDLEAARKAGTAPPEVDEDGNEINPHIPQYITQAPWYVDSGAPSLRHQRGTAAGGAAVPEPPSTSQWYARGARAATAATKFRPGACTNCGAMSHKTKECMERPRKVGAKFTGKDMAADEVVTDVKLGFEAKRDRWNGYDTAEHTRLMREWELVEEQRKRIKAKNLDEEMRARAAAPEDVLAEVDTSSESESDEDKYAEAADMAGQQFDAKSRQTVRNLRIREDVPKYLRNLDIDSAHYDPKTRSMRDNPLKGKSKSGGGSRGGANDGGGGDEDGDDEGEGDDGGGGGVDADYAGDAAYRFTGEGARAMTDTMLFTLRAADRGAEVHAQANPSQAEFLYREFLKKKEAVADRTKSTILDKYGGAEHLRKPAAALLEQSEDYVEYSLSGRVIKGIEREVARSQYPEDVYVNNHTSVWGSYWTDHKWGYACCHNTVRMSYCTGAAGREANASAAAFARNLGSATAAVAAGGTGGTKRSLAEEHAERLASGGGTASATVTVTASSLAHKRKLGEGEVEIDSDRLAGALDRERKRMRAAPTASKSRYGSTADPDAMTEEDLEAHRMLRTRGDDPMANYRDTI